LGFYCLYPVPSSGMGGAVNDRLMELADNCKVVIVL